ncbi:MAG: formate dehydrogenase accessory sulfurtransferase FdhD [Pseudomonadota bacterium]
MPETHQAVSVIRHDLGVSEASGDWLVQEVPVAMVFNGVSHAVMMATPADLEDFARGFAWTEGIVQGPHEWLDVEVHEERGGIRIEVSVAAACEWRLKERRRQLAGRTGCGLCGVEQLEHVHLSLPQVPLTQVPVSQMLEVVQSLAAAQPLQQRTGASHAAAWVDINHGVLCLREDAGRHNALDKAIGAAMAAKADPTHAWIAITSRASFEMVQKTAMAGVGALAAISAPTALAVSCAEQAGVALAGFVRPPRWVAYTYPERWQAKPAAT